jgi:type I restriction enzyme S subunit
MSAVPTIKLRDCTTKIGSGTTPRGGHTAYKQAGIPLIRSMNVRMNAFLNDGLAFIDDKQDAEMSGTRVLPGDVLLNITGASIGRVCVVPAEMCPANVNQHVCIIRSDGTLTPEWIAFFLSQPDFQKRILDQQSGATRQALTKEMIESFELPIPDLPTQRRLASRLKSQMAAVEEARRRVEEQAKAANRMSARWLTESFESEEANEWPVQKVGDACEFLPARSINLKGKAAVRAVTTACLLETGFTEAGVKDALMMEEDVKDACLSSGEILIARSNTPALVGRAALFEGSSQVLVASDLTIRLRVRDDLEPAFANGWFSYLFVSGYWRERASGASDTMKKIGRAQLAATDIPVPPLPTQRRIAARLREQFTQLQQLQSALSRQREALEALPGAFLREAFGSLQE